MKRSENMPALVYWGLLGLHSRVAALAFMWFCMALGAICLPLGFFNPAAFSGLLFFLAAGWYWYAVKWVDKHAAWD